MKYLAYPLNDISISSLKQGDKFWIPDTGINPNMLPPAGTTLAKLIAEGRRYGLECVGVTSSKDIYAGVLDPNIPWTGSRQEMIPHRMVHHVVLGTKKK